MLNERSLIQGPDCLTPFTCNTQNRLSAETDPSQGMGKGLIGGNVSWNGVFVRVTEVVWP